MGGLSYAMFPIALREMWIEYPIVFVLIFIILSIQCCTVCLIVPFVRMLFRFILKKQLKNVV